MAVASPTDRPKSRNRTFNGALFWLSFCPFFRFCSCEGLCHSTWFNRCPILFASTILADHRYLQLPALQVKFLGIILYRPPVFYGMEIHCILKTLGHLKFVTWQWHWDSYSTKQVTSFMWILRASRALLNHMPAHYINRINDEWLSKYSQPRSCLMTL